MGGLSGIERTAGSAGGGDGIYEGILMLGVI
jgi:hypothetical protein